MDLAAAVDSAQLGDICREARIPGAVLAVWHDGAFHAASHGVASTRTGLVTTTDTVFQVGSITKAWTATLVMMLVEEGALDLDDPVRSYLPSFQLTHEAAARRITLRHLLSHTSGIAGDHFHNTGRGSDCLERYVESCSELGLEHDVGATMSYCNTGYSLLGRVIEVASGHSFDSELRRRLIRPLGLSATGTLAEEAIMWPVAVGHLGEVDGAPTVAPAWHFPRSIAPAGMLHSTAEELLRFAALHLRGGVTADGTRILSQEAVTAMQEPQVECPDRWSLGTHWGIGWILYRDAAPGYGHDGATLGQYSFLRVLPEQQTAICLLTNGGAARHAWHQLFGQLARDVAGVEAERQPAAPPTPPDIDLANYTGRFGRLHVEADVEVEADGGLVVHLRRTGPLAMASAPGGDDMSLALTPVDHELFLAATPASLEPMPLVFFDFDGDRPRRFHHGGRAHTRL